MKCMPVRYTPMRHTPMRYTPVKYAREMHARNVLGKPPDLPPYKRWCGGRFVER
jgi:hypothetical protein